MTTVRRFGRAARWFHAGTYLSVLVALATGWWFVLDGYRNDSPAARALGITDAAIHELAGYAAAGVFLLWLPFGLRGCAGRDARADDARYGRSTSAARRFGAMMQ